jgi:hypothetical protein
MRVTTRMRVWTVVSLTTVVVLAPTAGAAPSPVASRAPATGPAPAATQVAAARHDVAPWSGFDPPHHGRLDLVAYGGQAEVRLADDRVAGVSNPDWLSMVRVGSFMSLRIHRRIRVVGEVAWDRATDDLLVERCLLEARVRETLSAHAGVLLLPLGRSNLHHDAPQSEFTERSLVATELVGVPSSQLGVGVRGFRRAGAKCILSYEVDIVSGYDDGLVMDSPEGTRLPRGRNNFGDNNGSPALAGRVALHPAPGAEFGLAAFAGQYNTTDLDGVTVDGARFAYLTVADGAGSIAGFRVAGEATMAFVDVPPGLDGLFAERQWGASLAVARTLRAPIARRWPRSSVGAAVRAEGVDFDRGVPGDSKTRLTASLNLRPVTAALLRGGWYYEVRRDRFDNERPAAGLTLGLATYF